MIVCIFAHVQRRWALNDGVAHGQVGKYDRCPCGTLLVRLENLPDEEEEGAGKVAIAAPVITWFNL
jgi:hypothetical protein